MRELLSMNREEIALLMQEKGQPGFRAKQLFSWLHQGKTWDEMTNLPKALRADLAEEYLPCSLAIEKVFTAKDGTKKYLYRLQDGHIVEGVLMRYHHGNTLCLSTQVGCRMGCAFCASTLDGCARDLSAGEMLSQVIAVNRDLPEGEKVSNIVLMGSGEALDNYDNTVRFLRLLREEDGLHLSLRGVSLSTCGLVERIYDFCGEDLPVTLSLSLHAPTDAIRRRIMPIARKYSIPETMDALRAYIEATGRRVIIEYALIEDLNSSIEQAGHLAGLLRGMQCHVNLIPLNDVPESDLRGADKKTVQAFQQALEKRHISVSLRREMGSDIQGACGQLRRKYSQKQGISARPNAN